MGWKEFFVALWAPIMGVLSSAAWPVAFAFAVWWARPLIVRLGDAVAQVIRERDWKIKIGSMFEAGMATLPQQATGPTETGLNAMTPPDSVTEPLDPRDAAGLPPPSTVEARYESEAYRALENLDPALKEPLLVRWVAEARAQGVFEYIFNRIFGSQVFFLTALNQSGGTLSLQQVQAHFDTAVAAHPGLAHPEGLHRWLHYLTNFELVRSENGHVHLTEIGREFLLYLVNAGLNPAARAL